MKTLLYTEEKNNIEKNLKTIIPEQISAVQIATCYSIENLSGILRQPLNNISVIILIITSRDELIQFNRINPLFDNSKVILILPDRDKATLSLAFKLKTSFISYIDNDLQDIVSVMKQIQKKLKGDKQNV